jgi:hypothetical protein
MVVARRAFISIEKTDKPVLLPVGHSFLIYESPAKSKERKKMYSQFC